MSPENAADRLDSFSNAVFDELFNGFYNKIETKKLITLDKVNYLKKQAAFQYDSKLDEIHN